MDDSPTPPRLFAHHVIKQMCQHLLGEDATLRLEDYMAIRTVFQWCKGSWKDLGEGDIVQLALLEKIISGWGRMPGRKKNQDELI